MRLDKLLSHSGFGTRKDVKKLIQSGAITINGETVTKSSLHIEPETDLVCCYDEPIAYQQYYYVMLNKPDGIISATFDHLHETVIDWVALDYQHVDLFPVGRLDIDTTGLLLLTNDGQLAHRLTSPKHQVPKVYQAKIAKSITDVDIATFQNGIKFDDYVTRPAQLRSLPSNQPDEIWAEVTIYEGKFHQVKKMFQSIDNLVLKLHRISMGPITLDEHLAEGEYRELTAEELRLLKEI